jgi:hypothetical protein
MSNHKRKFITMIIIVLFMSLTLFSGCKGSDTREKVDDTVEELAGKKKVDQMKKMEKDIGTITDKQSDRMDDVDKTGAEEGE